MNRTSIFVPKESSLLDLPTLEKGKSKQIRGSEILLNSKRESSKSLQKRNNLN